MSSAFSVHHVGARFGNSALQLPDAFAGDIEVTLYDADESCIEGLREREPSSSGSNVRVVSACLADAAGPAEFRLALNAPASSLLEPPGESSGYVQPVFGLDWDVARCAQVIERRPMVTQTLDALLIAEPDISRPDFLSLDTQGSELAILHGARRVIEANVVGLVIEVEFIELYSGAPTFSEIAAFLDDCGFAFAGFEQMITAQSSRQPLGRRTAGFPVAADALFLRRIDAVPASWGGADGGLARLAFASIATGHLDHAFAAIERLKADEYSVESHENMPTWARFVSELYAVASQSALVYPPEFTDVLRPEMHQAFGREPDINKWPDMLDLSSWKAAIHARGSEPETLVESLQKSEDSPLEAHLRSYGFTAIADQASFQRRHQAHQLLNLLAGRIGG